MANPITAIASRSCAKNSLLKQTTGGEKDDLSKGSSTTEVSTAADVQENIGGGRAISGDRTDTTITTPGSEGNTKTKKRLSYRDAWEQDLEGIRTGGGYTDVNDYIAKREAAKALDPEGTEAAIAAATGVSGGPGTVTITTPGTQGDSDTTSDFQMDQKEVKGMENLDLRGDIRIEKALNRLDRQAERRQDRFERKGLSGKDKRALRKEQRKDRRQSNIDRQQNIQNLIADRRALRDLQRDQGSFGGENYHAGKVTETKEGLIDRVSKKSFTPTEVPKPPKSDFKFTSNLNMDDLKIETPDLATGIKGILKTGSPAPLKTNYFNK